MELIELALFKTIVGDKVFTETIQIYYSNIGHVVSQYAGVDFHYKRSEIVLGFEFREVKEKQDFLECLTQVAKDYPNIELSAKPQYSIDSAAVSFCLTNLPRERL